MKPASKKLNRPISPEIKDFQQENEFTPLKTKTEILKAVALDCEKMICTNKKFTVQNVSAKGKCHPLTG